MSVQVGDDFSNASVRRHGRGYLPGLPSQAGWKKSWPLAQFAGDESPDAMRRLLNFPPCDEDDGRRRQLGTPEPPA